VHHHPCLFPPFFSSSRVFRRLACFRFLSAIPPTSFFSPPLTPSDLPYLFPPFPSHLSFSLVVSPDEFSTQNSAFLFRQTWRKHHLTPANLAHTGFFAHALPVDRQYISFVCETFPPPPRIYLYINLEPTLPIFFFPILLCWCEQYGPSTLNGLSTCFFTFSHF